MNILFFLVNLINYSSLTAINDDIPSIGSTYQTINSFMELILHIKNKYPNLKEKAFLEDKHFLLLNLIFSYGNLISESVKTLYSDSVFTSEQNYYLDCFADLHEHFNNLKNGEDVFDKMGVLIENLLKKAEQLYLHNDEEAWIFYKAIICLKKLNVYKSFDKNSVILFVQCSSEILNIFFDLYNTICRKFNLTISHKKAKHLEDLAKEMAKNFNHLKNKINDEYKCLYPRDAIFIDDMMLVFENKDIKKTDKEYSSGLTKRLFIGAIIGAASSLVIYLALRHKNKREQRDY